MEHTIWNSEVKVEDWKDFIDELNDDRRQQDEEPLTDEEAYDRIVDLNNDYLDDERMNLGGIVVNRILVIADLGTWRGRRQGYKIIESGKLTDCLYSGCDSMRWYCDDTDFRGDGAHHDGNNSCLYRGISMEEDIDELLAVIYNDEPYEHLLDKYTFSLRPQIAKVYGW